MKLQVIMYWALLGCFAASTAVNFQLLGLVRDARAEFLADFTEPISIELQPIVGEAELTGLQTLALSKQQRESIRGCSMT